MRERRGRDLGYLMLVVLEGLWINSSDVITPFGTNLVAGATQDNSVQIIADLNAILAYQRVGLNQLLLLSVDELIKLQ